MERCALLMRLWPRSKSKEKARREEPGWIIRRAVSKFSMVVEHSGSTRELMTLSPLLAVNLAEEFSKINSKVKVKWPNDLMTSEGKLSGILIETVKYAGRFYLVFGIGVNLFPNCELEEQINRNIAFLLRSILIRRPKGKMLLRFWQILYSK